MRKLVLTAMLASFAASAAADPLTDALEAGDGSLCFARHYDSAWLKAHPGQTLRDARLSLTYDPEDNSWTVMRVKLQTKARTIYLYGGCGWDEHVNRGVQDNILDPSYKPESGVGCHMRSHSSAGRRSGYRWKRSKRPRRPPPLSPICSAASPTICSPKSRSR